MSHEDMPAAEPCRKCIYFVTPSGGNQCLFEMSVPVGIERMKKAISSGDCNEFKGWEGYKELEKQRTGKEN